VRVVHAGPVRAELEVRMVLDLPECLSDDRTARVGTAACPVTMRVRLHAGSDRVEFETTIDNHARDHRLRVLVPATAHEHVRSEGHFLVLQRPDQVEAHPNWVEQPCSTHHHAGMVAAGDSVLLARGLPEYEMVAASDGDGWAIAQTLLRCVGWLSRDDLGSRPYNAGPTIPTPDAQCQGTHVFHYAIGLRGADADASLVRAAQELRQPLVVAPAGADPSGLLAIDGEDHAISALKLAEDGDGLVARVYAPSSGGASVSVRSSLGGVERCRIDETCVEPIDDGSIDLRGHEIATLRIARGGA
jgi:alpha-mannosidase